MSHPSPRSRKIRVGLFAAGALALTALVLIVFGGMRFWKEKDTYYIDVDDSVLGLESGAAVLHSGIRVGTVEDLGISKHDFRLVRVRIEVDEGTPIKADTEAQLKYVGVTGLKIVDLKAGTPA